MQSKEKSIEEIGAIIEVREFGRGRSNIRGQKITLDEVYRRNLELQEEVRLFQELDPKTKTVTRRGIRAKLLHGPVVELSAGLNVLFLKDGRSETRSVQIPRGQQVNVRPFNPEGPSHIPESRITHLKEPLEGQREPTAESPAQPEPQDSPRRSGAEYPER